MASKGEPKRGAPMESLGAPNGHICDRWGAPTTLCWSPFLLFKKYKKKGKNKKRKLHLNEN